MKRDAVRAIAAAAAVGLFALLMPGHAAPPSVQPPVAAPSPMTTLPAILTRDAAYMSGPPQMIAPARCETILPHPEGRYTLIVQRDEALPPGPQTGKETTGGCSLVLWDGLSRRSRIVWQHVAVSQIKSSGGVGNVFWMAGTSIALAYTVVSERDLVSGKTVDTWSLLFLDPLRDSRARVLRSGNQPTGFYPSPLLPVALISEIAFTPETTEPYKGALEVTYHVLNARGLISPALDLPSGTRLSGWSKDGATAYAIWQEKREKRVVLSDTEPPPSAPPISHWFAVDVHSGAVVPLTEKPNVMEPMRRWQEAKSASTTGELRLTTGKAAYVAPDGTPAPEPLHPLFLQPAALAPSPTPQHSLFLAPHADESYLLADNSAVFYVSQHTGYVVPLVKLTRDQYALALREVYRARAVSNAKQIGLALLGYVLDHDERFPPSGDIAAMAGAYVRNADIFQDPSTGKSGFTYLLNGDPQAKMENVSVTRIGYLSGPGGRAVLFADGHVQWEDNP